jgi:hypothetical protein
LLRFNLKKAITKKFLSNRLLIFSKYKTETSKKLLLFNDKKKAKRSRLIKKYSPFVSVYRLEEQNVFYFFSKSETLKEATTI